LPCTLLYEEEYVRAYSFAEKVGRERVIRIHGTTDIVATEMGDG
jgi:hypothetical protein